MKNTSGNGGRVDVSDGPDSTDTTSVLGQAVELAAAARKAEDHASSLRAQRDHAITQLIERGHTTRWLGGQLGLTATQVSAIWRREHPARAPGRRPRGAAPPPPESGGKAKR
jgi:hypothetical protein